MIENTSVTACTTGKVALEDRVDHQLADARQRVDLLDHERAADEIADVDAEHGDGRDDRVAERVTHEHARLRQALRARGGHVFRLEHLEQARAQAADQDRRDPERDRQRRQEHRVQVADEPAAVAADRERAPEVQPEDEQQHDPDPEGREAEPDQRHRTDEVVGDAVAVRRGDRRQRHRDQHRQQRPEADQPERHRQPLQHEVPGGDAVEERVAEVAVHDPPHELPVLDRQMGRSRPHSWWSSATRAGVAWLPRIVAAGSPGTRWIRKKTRIVTPSAIGTSCSRRRRTYPPRFIRLSQPANRTRCPALRAPDTSSDCQIS